MRRKSLILAIAAVLGFSTGAGTVVTSFAAEAGVTVQENVFDDGSEDIEVEEPETEDIFEAGESQIGVDADFEDGENESEIESAATGSQDFRYQIDGILEQVTIVKYEGTQADVVIPEEIEGYPVTKISSGIFSENNEIQSLTITGNICEIGEDAFKGLDNLERVTISTKQKEIKGLDFSENQSLRLVEMSGALEVLNSQIFSGCSSLVKVVFPPNLKEIGGGAFSGTGIESMVVPDSVSELGIEVFSSCENLKSVILSKNMKIVPAEAFWGDRNLREVTLYNGIEIIGEAAFEFSGIEKINLPSTLKLIKKEAFHGVHLTELDVPSSVTEIEEGALATKLEKLIIRGNTDFSIWSFYYLDFNYPKRFYGTRTSIFEEKYRPIHSPANLILSTPDDSTIHIAWSPLNDEAEYKIYRSETPNGPFSEIATTFNSFWDDKDLDSTTNYYYQVCAYYKDDDVLGNISPVLERGRVSIKDCTIESIGDQWYTGNEIKPQISVKYQGTALINGKDFSVAYLNNIEEGIATVQIKGIKNPYYDVQEINFQIKKRNIESLKVTSSKSTYTYTGKDIKPVITVKSDLETLVEGIDYTVEYKNNIRCGIATATVNGIGKYTGVKTVTFKIIKSLAKPVISSVTAGGTDKITIKWKKVKNAKGYEIYRKSQFNKKYQKIKTISNGNTTQYTNYGLGSGTKYTYKIRSYYISDGEKIYSAYSSPKSRTTKVAKLYTGTYVYTEGRTEWFVKIYKSGGNYYAEVGRNRTLARSTYKLTNYKTNYYGAGGDWRIYIVGNGYNSIQVAYEYGDNDEDYVYYSRRSW